MIRKDADENAGIEVQGDQDAFAHWTHVWRRSLELLHDALVGPTPADEEPEQDEDHIVGRYVYVTSPVWGKCKIFYEQSGEGDQDIVFLHTAGSDSRQYHGVLNDERMRQKCRMIAFDLPAHGRSFPYEGYWPGASTISSFYPATHLYFHYIRSSLPLTRHCRHAHQYRRCLRRLYRRHGQEA